MPIVTTHYRPKRATRKKRKQPAIVSAIVTPAPPRPLKGPVIRLRDQTPDKGNDDGQAQPQRRSAIVEPKRKRSSIFGPLPDMTPEEHWRRREAAGKLWRELVRRATGEDLK